jgi:hypothetical protein
LPVGTGEFELDAAVREFLAHPEDAARVVVQVLERKNGGQSSRMFFSGGEAAASRCAA